MASFLRSDRERLRAADASACLPGRSPPVRVCGDAPEVSGGHSDSSDDAVPPGLPPRSEGCRQWRSDAPRRRPLFRRSLLSCRCACQPCDLITERLTMRSLGQRVLRRPAHQCRWIIGHARGCLGAGAGRRRAGAKRNQNHKGHKAKSGTHWLTPESSAQAYAYCSVLASRTTCGSVDIPPEIVIPSITHEGCGKSRDLL